MDVKGKSPITYFSNKSNKIEINRPVRVISETKSKGENVSPLLGSRVSRKNIGL